MLLTWFRRWVSGLRFWRESEPDVSHSDWAELRSALQEAKTVVHTTQRRRDS